MPPEFLILANPTAGRRQAPALAQQVLALLRKAGRAAELTCTQAQGDARRLAADAVTAGVQTVVGCGGDGTLQEIASALAGSASVMAILPSGRCNDLARALLIHRDDSPDLLTTMLLTGPVRKIDLGSYTFLGTPKPGAAVPERHFCTVATLGFDTQVTQFVLSHRFPFKGTPEYLYGILRVLLSFRAPRVRLSGDFGAYEGRILLAATGNTPSYGGAMRIAPSAQLDDGLFDLCVVGEVPRRTVLWILPKVFKGQHVTHPAVKMFRTKQLTIEAPEGPAWICADGELLGETPARLEVITHVLNVRLKAKI